MAVLKPLGFWGLGGLSFVDAGLFPIPPTMDLVVIGYVTTYPSRLVLYCLVAALGSALGCLIPFYIGRAGGELFLLKRINRERFEQIRDQFEKQEFLAIAIPAMIPPPFPLKVFEFAAGVFEMKPLLFAAAIFTGKFIRFLIFAILTVVYGPAILHQFTHQLHAHFSLVLGGLGLVVVGLVWWVVRRTMDRRGMRVEPENET
ncbi:MAG: DedA family protein [Acidobacteriota bacterium]|nr:DedA family protein [Acidobacteriota bacterium]